MKVFSPKEKADYLVEEFLYIENEYKEYLDFKQAKECALIAVEEILNGSRLFYEQDYTYWNTVKEEIGKL
jgi:hypothetical protein